MNNLANLDTAAASEIVYDLELKHPTTEEPLGLFIQIVGVHAREVKRVSDRQINEVLLNNYKADRGAKDAVVPTVQQGERRGAALLAAATRGWFSREPGKKAGDPDIDTPGLPFGETRLMFSPEEAEKLYENTGYLWLRKQVDAGVGDLGNFIKA